MVVTPIKKDVFEGTQISTIFINMNDYYSLLQNLGMELLPGYEEQNWYETMIFGGVHDMKQWRCKTEEEALKQHEEALALVASTFGPKH